MEGRGRSFVRKSVASASDVQLPGARPGPNGVSLVSSGLTDLDEIIGGGIPVGGIVMVMEGLDAPHHMLLLRYFMAQAVAHGHPLLFASPLASPKAFLGTLPGLATGEQLKNSKSSADASSKGGDLRIAWQYRRYLNEQQDLADRRLRQKEKSQSWTRGSSQAFDPSSVHTQEYCSNFDLRKPMERSFLTAENIETVSLQGAGRITLLQETCVTFFDSLKRTETGGNRVGRVALHSLCAPQCMHSISDWEMLGFLHGLRSRLRKARAVAFITFPAILLNTSFRARWQHVADILLSIEAVRDDDKDLESMFMGYRDMVGFLRVHKLASINTQVPAVPEVGPFAIKVLQKKKIVIERLYLAPVDASGGSSGGTVSLLCAQPANAPSVLDF